MYDNSFGVLLDIRSAQIEMSLAIVVVVVVVVVVGKSHPFINQNQPNESCGSISTIILVASENTTSRCDDDDDDVLLIAL
jgi:hypothetical protein